MSTLLKKELGRQAGEFPGRGGGHHGFVAVSEGTGFSRDLEEQVTSALIYTTWNHQTVLSCGLHAQRRPCSCYVTIAAPPGVM